MKNSISSEPISVHEQIKYIQRKIENIKNTYCYRYIDSFGREYDIDLEWFKIETKYGQLIEEEQTPEGKLKYCEMMYQECMDLVYEEIESRPEPLLFEKDACGGDSILIVHESQTEMFL